MNLFECDFGFLGEVEPDLIYLVEIQGISLIGLKEAVRSISGSSQSSSFYGTVNYYTLGVAIKYSAIGE
jgi:hypothetical protein